MDLIHEIVNQIFLWLRELGYIGIMVALMIEVIPSEIPLAYAGYLVSIEEIHFVGAVLAGTFGGTMAHLFIYWIGRYGGRPVLEKYGRYILISKHHIDKSEEWFQRYGSGVVFTARFIPVVRHAISIPAGIAKMPLGKFTILTVLAVIPWSVLFIYLGMLLGNRWEEINELASPYVKPIIITAIALSAGYFIVKMMRNRKN